MSEAQQEEEALRQELQDLRRMAKGSSAMEEENKKLKRKAGIISSNVFFCFFFSIYLLNLGGMPL